MLIASANYIIQLLCWLTVKCKYCSILSSVCEYKSTYFYYLITYKIQYDTHNYQTNSQKRKRNFYQDSSLLIFILK